MISYPLVWACCGTLLSTSLDDSPWVCGETVVTSPKDFSLDCCCIVVFTPAREFPWISCDTLMMTFLEELPWVSCGTVVFSSRAIPWRLLLRRFGGGVRFSSSISPSSLHWARTSKHREKLTLCIAAALCKTLLQMEIGCEHSPLLQDSPPLSLVWQLVTRYMVKLRTFSKS